MSFAGVSSYGGNAIVFADSQSSSYDEAGRLKDDGAVRKVFVFDGFGAAIIGCNRIGFERIEEWIEKNANYGTETVWSLCEKLQDALIVTSKAADGRIVNVFAAEKKRNAVVAYSADVTAAKTSISRTVFRDGAGGCVFGGHSLYVRYFDANRNRLVSANPEDVRKAVERAVRFLDPWFDGHNPVGGEIVAVRCPESGNWNEPKTPVF